MNARSTRQRLEPTRRFTRRWWPDALRALLWTAGITVLIWVYADLHFTEPMNISLSVRIHAGNSGKLVLMSPADWFFQLDVDGNRNSIGPLDGRKLAYDAAELGPGEHVLAAEDLLSKLPDLRTAGAKILSVRPAKVQIDLDSLKTVSAPVELDLGGAAADEVVIEPDRVDVLAPEGLVSAGAVIRVQTRPIDLSKSHAGEKVVLDRVELRPPDLPGARLITPAVKVSFVVGRQLDRKTFTLPIRIDQPKDWAVDDTWITYKLDLKDPLQWTREITVAGPRIELDKLQPDSIDAYVVLTENDQKVLESWTEKEVRVKIVGGRDVNTKLMEIVPPLPKVELRLVKRAASP